MLQFFFFLLIYWVHTRHPKWTFRHAGKCRGCLFVCLSFLKTVCISLNCIITSPRFRLFQSFAVPNKLASSFICVLANCICRLMRVNFAPWRKCKHRNPGSHLGSNRVARTEKSAFASEGLRIIYGLLTFAVKQMRGLINVTHFIPLIQFRCERQYPYSRWLLAWIRIVAELSS